MERACGFPRPKPKWVKVKTSFKSWVDICLETYWLLLKVIYHHENSTFINVHNTYVCENILTFIKINIPSLMLNFLQCLCFSHLELSFCYHEVSISSFSPMYYCSLSFPSIITKIPLYLMWYHMSCRIFQRRHKVTMTYKVSYGY